MGKIKLNGMDIIYDYDATNNYRDMYNEQCQCNECKNFRLKFSTCYPEIISFLKEYGIDVNYPLEIMDLGFNDEKIKREYSVFYSVKGKLPIDKIQVLVSNVRIVLRNWNISNESYSNTGMQKPYFIIEVLDLFIEDIKYEFYDSVKTGREIEFRYGGKKYFESHNSDIDWYIFCEETESSQHFKSADDLLEYAILGSQNINDLWHDIKIDYIL